ncbi:MAG: hypothetical protein V4721_10275 [Bacteroidota bacterium]
MIIGLDNYVTLRESDHRYFDKDGREYMSASKFLGLFYEPFDANFIAGQVAASEGVPKQVILDRWQAQTDLGTHIHEAIQRYNNTTEMLPEDEYLRPAILNIAFQYKDYYRRYNEVVLYDKDEFLAGTADHPLVTTSHKNSVIDIGDWKCYGNGINQKDLDKHGKPRNKYMLHCLDHLQASSYNKVALQLSLYAYMLQKATGRKIGKLFAHWINPINPLINIQLPVPYMKHEIIAMIAWRKENATVITTEPEEKTSAIESFVNDEWDL